MRHSYWLAAASLLTLTGTFGNAQAQVSHYEPSKCPAEVVADEKIDCGTLSVPENRQVANSRMINLPVIIFRSRSTTPAADPLIFLTGGPGNSNVRGKRSGKNNPFLDQRDQIYLEPRGAQFARPWLDCPEYASARLEIDAGRTDTPSQTDGLVKAATACRARLAGQGIDLNGYTSAEAADDIEDLRIALGYRQVNLLGLSYGTRLALTYVRRHPEAVRSVILDSVLPPEANFDEMATDNLTSALDHVAIGCLADRKCVTAYPDLRHQLADLVAHSEKPVPVTAKDVNGRPIVVRSEQVVGAIYDKLHDTQAIGTIPRFIAEMADNRFVTLSSALEGMSVSNAAWGLRLSVWCAEEMPFENAALVTAQRAAGKGLGGIDEATTRPEICKAWNVTPAPAIENEPVTNATVPMLIFAGEFDPDTPPAWGRSQLAHFPNARFVLMPGQSHGASFNRCGGTISLAFVTDPSAPLALDCVARMPGVDFGQAAPQP